MLSVLVTIYKRTDYTEKTIMSLLQNKDNPIELIVAMDWTDKKTHEQIKNLYDNRSQTDWSIMCLVPMQDVWLVNLWNKGIENANNKDILIVNDDILISKSYDTAIQNDLKNHFIVCPLYTEGENYFAGNPKQKRTNINWHARAIKSFDWRKVWPIDNRLKLWFSDDYIFRTVIDLKQKPYWTENCIVHHYRSQTINDPKNKQHVDLTH